MAPHPLIWILVTAVGCASSTYKPATTAPAQVQRLDCGGNACAITTVGEEHPVTLITVSE